MEVLKCRKIVYDAKKNSVYVVYNCKYPFKPLRPLTSESVVKPCPISVPCIDVQGHAATAKAMTASRMATDAMKAEVKPARDRTVPSAV